MTEVRFCNWDGRPAVLFPGPTAFAVLLDAEGKWGSTWEEVEGFDVSHSGRIMTREVWSDTFRGALAAAGPWPALMPEPTFTDWEGRPAVLFSGRIAYAVLGESLEDSPKDGWDTVWTKVDSDDVANTAGVMTREAWSNTFRYALASAGPWPTAPS